MGPGVGVAEGVGVGLGVGEGAGLGADEIPPGGLLSSPPHPPNAGSKAKPANMALIVCTAHVSLAPDDPQKTDLRSLIFPYPQQPQVGWFCRNSTRPLWGRFANFRFRRENL